MRTWLRKYPLGGYFALTYLPSWIGIAVIAGPDGLLGRDPQVADRLPLVLVAMLVGPVVAGLALTWPAAAPGCPRPGRGPAAGGSIRAGTPSRR